MPLWAIQSMTFPLEHIFHPRGGRSDQNHAAPESWLWVTQPQPLIAMRTFLVRGEAWRGAHGMQ